MKYLRQNTVIKKVRPTNSRLDQRAVIINNFSNPEYLKELKQQKRLSVFKNLLENLYTSEHYKNVFKENKAKIFLDDQEIDFNDAFKIGKAIKQKERIRIQKQKEMVTTRRKLLQNNAYDNINNPEFNSNKNKIYNFASPKTKEEILQSFITSVPYINIKRNNNDQNENGEKVKEGIQNELSQKSMLRSFTMPFYSLPFISYENQSTLNQKIDDRQIESPEEIKLYEKFSKFTDFQNKVISQHKNGKYSHRIIPNYEELMYDIITRENNSKNANKELETVKNAMFKLNTDFVKASSNIDRFKQTNYYHKPFQQKRIMINLFSMKCCKNHSVV